jgi:hypothetical protein
MTTSDMGFPVTQEREEVQCWCVEDRPVVFFLTSVITDCIRELQDEGKGTVTRVSKCVFLTWRCWIGSGDEELITLQNTAEAELLSVCVYLQLD